MLSSLLQVRGQVLLPLWRGVGSFPRLAEQCEELFVNHVELLADLVFRWVLENLHLPGLKAFLLREERGQALLIDRGLGQVVLDSRSNSTKVPVVGFPSLFAL